MEENESVLGGQVSGRVSGDEEGAGEDTPEARRDVDVTEGRSVVAHRHSDHPPAQTMMIPRLAERHRARPTGDLARLGVTGGASGGWANTPADRRPGRRLAGSDRGCPPARADGT